MQGWTPTESAAFGETFLTARVLHQPVQRNLDRFLEDFMFQVTRVEAQAWEHLIRSRSQIVTVKKTSGLAKY